MIAVVSMDSEIPSVTRSGARALRVRLTASRFGCSTTIRARAQRIADHSLVAADRGFDELRYIQRHAAHHDGRIVIIGQLVLFSADTDDAWLLDRSDWLAARLARNGETEAVHIEKTDTAFTIGWKGRHRLVGGFLLSRAYRGRQ